MNKILLVEDDLAVRRSLELHLTAEGYSVVTAPDGHTGVEMASSQQVTLVILDLRLPDIDGFEVLRRIKCERPNLQVIVVTAFDDMQTTIETIKLGAADHLGKPLDLAELDNAIEKLADTRRMCAEGLDLGAGDDEDKQESPAQMIIGRSLAMKRVFKEVGAVVNSSATVLLQGESGTGKEVVANAIHANSPRSQKPFVAVTCSVLNPSLIESELFGHERGAFTGAQQQKTGKFEQANGGTLFLDEISEIPPSTQVKLLRFLQEREFERVGGIEKISADVRIIAATNRDLAQMVADGDFRRDLFYRLNVVNISLPPLRERKEDIPLLVRYYLKKLSAETQKRIEIVPEEVMKTMERYPWPGNVRELENTLRRALLLSHSNVLLPEALKLKPEAKGVSMPLMVMPLHEVERAHIENVLKYTNYEKKRAAEILDISRPTLDRRVRQYGINTAAGSQDTEE